MVLDTPVGKSNLPRFPPGSRKMQTERYPAHKCKYNMIILKRMTFFRAHGTMSIIF